jgi:soluble P-type ATPase
MLEVDVPGWQRLRLDELVLDVNGTLTCDGVLLPGIRERVAAMRSILEVRLLSADTFGVWRASRPSLASLRNAWRAASPRPSRRLDWCGIWASSA